MTQLCGSGDAFHAHSRGAAFRKELDDVTTALPLHASRAGELQAGAYTSGVSRASASSSPSRHACSSAVTSSDSDGIVMVVYCEIWTLLTRRAGHMTTGRHEVDVSV